MRHALVRSLVLHYLDHFGYAGPRVRVFTTPARVLRLLEKRGEKTRADERSAKKHLGWCIRYPRTTVIYVNVQAHDSLAELLDTCAEEALHASKYVGHPPGFAAEVAEAVLA